MQRMCSVGCSPTKLSQQVCDNGVPSDRTHSGPRRTVPAFVPAPLLIELPRLVLAHALHRDALGASRPGCSAVSLAAAIISGEVICDPLTVHWLPPAIPADKLMLEAWYGRTGHEGTRHRRLRGVAAVLLTAWAGAPQVRPEVPLHAKGRGIRPDLVAARSSGDLIAFEVGVVEGDAVQALISTDSRNRPSRASHVAVLPFAGQGATVAHGYVFRRSTIAALVTPKAVQLRSAWAELRQLYAPTRRWPR